MHLFLSLKKGTGKNAEKFAEERKEKEKEKKRKRKE
jgi:hypothetical protein